MSEAFKNFRALSMSAYMLLFGAIFGYTTFGYTVTLQHGGVATPNTGLLSVWILSAFVGLILVGIKNRKIANPQLKPRITIADLLVTVALLILITVLPTSLGLVRSFIVLLVVATYISIYVNLLYKGKLVEKAL